jgi:hypothetical protein
VKASVFVVALGVALSSCASVEKVAPLPVAPPPPSRIALAPPQPGPWHIRKTEWTDADEKAFGEFVREIAESGCTTTVSCMQSAANFYHDSDPPTLLFHADCAKWVYMLRAYYASKNGLPFSYVSKISGNGPDLRFTTASNTALLRSDIVDTGTGIDTASVLQHIHDEVYSATYRMDPAVQAPIMQDFYSPKLQPGSIRAGTAIYDITGHVMLVYEITPDGSIRYMDAHPDESVTHGNFGAHIPKSAIGLGGGFKNFRPLKLVGAELRPDGTYVGGQVVLASNEAIPDYSLEQYRGNVASADNSSARFRYNNASLDLYEYARASMSNGGFAFNPVYELQVSMGSICKDAMDGSRDARNRVRSGLTALYTDLSQNLELWKQRDLRVAYHGISFKQTLANTYADQEQACITTASTAGETKNPIAWFVRRWPGTDVPTLIARIDDTATFAGMRPVGY